MEDEPSQGRARVPYMLRLINSTEENNRRSANASSESK
jgi:hypothetical protein